MDWFTGVWCRSVDETAYNATLFVYIYDLINCEPVNFHGAFMYVNSNSSWLHSRIQNYRVI
jgi:hypothetical protein